MAGLNLFAGGQASAGVNTGLPSSYGGSAAGQTISSRAYGVGSDGPNCGPATPGIGLATAGTIGAVILLYLWWSLPN